MRVIEGLYDGVTTSNWITRSEIAATMTTTHPDYAQLAARISVSNLHKNTKKSFSATMKDLYEYINPRTGKKLHYFPMRYIKSLKRMQTKLIPISSIIEILDMIFLVLKH